MSEQIPGTEAELVEYGNLVGFYVDKYREFHGEVPPRQFRDRFGREIGKLIKEHVSGDVLRLALEIAAERGLNPDQLVNAVVTAQTSPRRSVAKASNSLLDRFLIEHDGAWPTGTRMIRGTHSADWVQDVLGYDKAPYPVVWGRPKRDAVIAALKALDDAGVDVARPDVRQPREGT